MQSAADATAVGRGAASRKKPGRAVASSASKSGKVSVAAPHGNLPATIEANAQMFGTSGGYGAWRYSRYGALRNPASIVRACAKTWALGPQKRIRSDDEAEAVPAAMKLEQTVSPRSTMPARSPRENRSERPRGAESARGIPILSRRQTTSEAATSSGTFHLQPARAQRFITQESTTAPHAAESAKRPAKDSRRQEGWAAIGAPVRGRSRRLVSQRAPALNGTSSRWFLRKSKARAHPRELSEADRGEQGTV